jgi:hypothetical protein
VTISGAIRNKLLALKLARDGDQEPCVRLGTMEDPVTYQVSFLPSWLAWWWRDSEGVEGKLPLPALPSWRLAKFPTASWQMPKACSRAQAGAAANENLGAVAARAGRGLGAGARLQLQLVPLWRLPNPSQQVHNTWAERSTTREGKSYPPSPTQHLGFPMECPPGEHRRLGYRKGRMPLSPDP